jgi:hypothetical protein
VQLRVQVARALVLVEAVRVWAVAPVLSVMHLSLCYQSSSSRQVPLPMLLLVTARC